MLQDAAITTGRIRIRFRGLLVFCFDKRRKYCQIGALSKDDHELRVHLVKRGPDPESESEQTLTMPHGLIRQSSDLWLDVEGEPSPKRQAAEPFIAGRRDVPATDPQDFRRVIDLEGEHFYNRPLKVRSGVLGPILVVTTGLFYSARLTSDSYLALPDVTKRARGATKALGKLGQIAEYIGADLCLHPKQALVLRAGRNGPELLRLEREEGVTYEVAVENLDKTQATVGRDFGHYYEAFELNQEEPRIFPVPYGLPSFGGEMGGICFVVWLSRSDGLMVE
jgi:hypothetical protein